MNFKDKVQAVDVKRALYEILHVADWKGQVRHMKKHLHFVFEKLQGFQCRQHIAQTKEKGRPDQTRSEDIEWNVGFDLIETNGPRDHLQNNQLRWITIQTATRTPSIYKYCAGGKVTSQPICRRSAGAGPRDLTTHPL